MTTITTAYIDDMHLHVLAIYMKKKHACHEIINMFSTKLSVTMQFDIYHTVLRKFTIMMIIIIWLKLCNDMELSVSEIN